MESAPVVEDATIGSPKQTGGQSRRNQLVFFIAAALLLHGLLQNSLDEQASKRLMVGDDMPSFSLELADGTQTSEKDFVGSPTIYFFYAGWCPCSHVSTTQIKKANSMYGVDGLKILGVGIQDSSESLRDFTKKLHVSFPSAVSGGDDVARAIGVVTTPTTVFVDADGHIASFYVGRLDRFEQMDEGLAAIINTHKNNELSEHE